MTTSELQRTGNELRTAVLNRFRALRGSAPDAFGPGNGPGVDISDLVTQYITAGTSFTDAAAILRAAKYNVGAPPPRPIVGPGNKLRRFQILAGTTLEAGLGYKFWLSIALVPQDPVGMDTQVKAVSARILYSAL